MKALVFSALQNRGAVGRKHESMLRELGFEEVETREYPAKTPIPGAFRDFDMVIAIKDHSTLVDVRRIEHAARADNITFFYATKREMTDEWQRIKEWCADHIATADAPMAVPSVRVISHELPPKEKRELEEWKEMSESLASENDELKLEKERLANRVEHLEKDLKTARDEAIKAKKDVTDAQREAQQAREARDEQSSRVRTLEKTASDLRAEIVDLKAAMKPTPKNGHSVDRETVLALATLVRKGHLTAETALGTIVKGVERS